MIIRQPDSKSYKYLIDVVCPCRTAVRNVLYRVVFTPICHLTSSVLCTTSTSATESQSSAEATSAATSAATTFTFTNTGGA